MEEANYLKCISGVLKTILKRGEASRKPTDGSVCCAVFSNISGGDYSDSEHLLSTTSTVTIGAGHEIIDRVIEYCIQTMTVSEESEFHVDALNLKFTAFLDNCFFKPYSFQMSDVEKLSLARFFKEQGVKLFNQGKVSPSFLKFRRALQYILVMNLNFYVKDITGEESMEISDVDHNEVSDLRQAIYNNLALCHFQYKNHSSVLPLCTKSLQVKPNVKAYYRRAVSYAEENEYEKAEKDLEEALKIDENNKAALEKIKLVRELNKRNMESYKTVVKKMFL